MLKLIICLSLFLSAVFCSPLNKGSEKPKIDCGISPALEKYGSNDTDKTLEGPASIPGDWPWVVSMRSADALCTATLISDKWVLTAAHCIEAEDDIEIYAGSTNSLKGQKLEVKKTHVHPKWDDELSTNDIALVEISKVTFNDQISPICLSSKLTNSPKDDTIAVGFGRTWEGNGTESTKMLHEDIVPIRPWKHCEGLRNHGPIDSKTEICAGKGMHSVYHGDSGGPLMEILDNKFYEVGITSWGYPNDDSQITNSSDFEDVFTLVPAYCNWIAKTTKGDVKCE